MPERHVEILTDAEIRAMIKLASPRDALIVQLLAESGIRLGELGRRFYPSEVPRCLQIL